MKSQEHNKGELRTLTVNIEKDVVDSVETMAKVGGISIDEIVVVALKRYRSSHADLEGKIPRIE
jgi:fructose-1,6-bisphosphatase/sedoheptulose 1,7-bisphosphatase-like protein